jgi:hypothetical protein
MAAPKGNEYWKLADWGKPRSYQPEQLWEKACEYFQWCENNPWMKNEAVKSGDNTGLIIQVPTSRPYTIHALCIYAGIITQTFHNYEKEEAYLEICKRIREIIYSQKFEGAAVGAFNANIIARDLGLKESQEIKHEVTTGIFNIDPLADDPTDHSVKKDSPA